MKRDRPMPSPMTVALTKKVQRLEKKAQKYKTERDDERRKAKKLSAEKNKLEKAIGDLVKTGFRMLKSGWTPIVVRDAVHKVFVETGPPQRTLSSVTEGSLASGSDESGSA